mmetsp:Transcript_3475/g.2909  ORF Transcript_3475/g.2909 Transcript_3475/m.2909 type:complete len:137 (-) Transcript_3475:16-426(-)
MAEIAPIGLSFDVEHIDQEYIKEGLMDAQQMKTDLQNDLGYLPNSLFVQYTIEGVPGILDPTCWVGIGCRIKCTHGNLMAVGTHLTGTLNHDGYLGSEILPTRLGTDKALIMKHPTKTSKEVIGVIPGDILNLISI